MVLLRKLIGNVEMYSRNVDGLDLQNTNSVQQVYSAIFPARPRSNRRIVVVDCKGVEAACRTFSTPLTTNRDPIPSPTGINALISCL
jgi:hypothetical protein